jgi:hypothetical protein
LRKHHIEDSDDVLAAIRTAASGSQSAPEVAIVVEIHNRNRLADYNSVSGHRDVILESLAKRPELFVFAISIECNLRDQFV